MEQLNTTNGSVTWLAQFKGLLRYVLSCPEPAPIIKPAPASFFSSTEEVKTPEVEEMKNYYEIISYEVIMFLCALVVSLALVFLVDFIIQSIVYVFGSNNSYGGSLESTTTSPATSRPSSPPKLPNSEGVKRIAMNEPINCVYTRENKNKTENTQSQTSNSVSSEANFSVGTLPNRSRVSFSNTTPNLRRRSSRTQASITGSTASNTSNSPSTAVLATDVKSGLRTQSTVASASLDNVTDNSPKTSQTDREANSEPEGDERMNGGRSPVGLGAELKDLNVVLTTYFENYGFNSKEKTEAPPTTPVLHLSCHESSPIAESKYKLNEYVWEKLSSEKNRLPTVGSISNVTYAGYDDDDARSSIGSWESDCEARMKESEDVVYLKDVMRAVEGFATPFESLSEVEVSRRENLQTENTQICSPIEDSTNISPEGKLATGKMNLSFGLGDSDDENIDMVIYAGIDSDGSIIGDEGSFTVEENQKVKVIWTGAKENEKVSLTGSFLNWKKNIRLERKGENRHECTLELAAGTHTYRMLVEEDN